jgi:hypothetical protein
MKLELSFQTCKMSEFMVQKMVGPYRGPLPDLRAGDPGSFHQLDYLSLSMPAGGKSGLELEWRAMRCGSMVIVLCFASDIDDIDVYAP